MRYAFLTLGFLLVAMFCFLPKPTEATTTMVAFAEFSIESACGAEGTQADVGVALEANLDIGGFSFGVWNDTDVASFAEFEWNDHLGTPDFLAVEGVDDGFTLGMLWDFGPPPFDCGDFGQGGPEIFMIVGYKLRKNGFTNLIFTDELGIPQVELLFVDCQSPPGNLEPDTINGSLTISSSCP